jgi:hypothetical protein
MLPGRLARIQSCSGLAGLGKYFGEAREHWRHGFAVHYRVEDRISNAITTECRWRIIRRYRSRNQSHEMSL